MYKLLVKDGLLFACGGFNYAGNVPAAFTATWDGERWCGLGGSLDPFLGALSIGFYGDTLFVGCGNTADGRPVNHLARYTGTHWGDTCSVAMGPTSVAEVPAECSPALVALGSGWYMLKGNLSGTVLRVYQASGALVRTLRIDRGPDGSGPFDLSGLSAGIYVLDVPGTPALKLSVVP
ncbi:MAG: hypothetical protein QM724_00525 [Flavobacteriales bacterium]